MLYNTRENIFIKSTKVARVKRFPVDSKNLHQIFTPAALNFIGNDNLLKHFHLSSYKSVSIEGEEYKTEEKDLCKIFLSAGLVDYQTALKEIPELAEGHPGGGNMEMFKGSGRVTLQDQEDYVCDVKDMYAKSLSSDEYVSGVFKRGPLGLSLINKQDAVINSKTGEVLYAPKL